MPEYNPLQSYLAQEPITGSPDCGELDHGYQYHDALCRWLARHKNVHFHYTPTHASWLNQIEIWFSLLTRFALRPQSFTHPRQVRQAIDAYTEVSNEHATPFEWTKRYVAQKPLRHQYSNLHN